MNNQRYFWRVTGLLILLLGCDGVNDPAAGCINDLDCGDDQICVEGFCKGAQNDTLQFNADASTGGLDETSPNEVESTDATAQEELPPEDTTRPKVVEITPTDGTDNISAPVSIQVTFSEPLKVGLDKNTLSVTDVNGVLLTGSYSSNNDQSVWSFIPNSALKASSPYKIEVNYPLSAIMDFAGNKMQGTVSSTFYTAPPKNLVSYKKLARKYAPVVYLETRSSKTQLDYITQANLDGDWLLTNNKAYVEKSSNKSILPTVHSGVIESQSHYFFHYGYYWPTRFNSTGMESFENDAAGTTIVVEKWTNQGLGRPVEVLTWYKKKSAEYVRAFVTTESQIYTDADTGKSISDSFDGIHPQDTLFPDNRVINWLSAGTHESCAWANSGNQYGCELNAAKRDMMTYLELHLSEEATPIEKEDKWPTGGSYDYQLIDLLESWWPRRADFGSVFYESSSSFTHIFESDKASVNYPRYFVGAAGEQGLGRAIWAVKWQPKEPNKSYTSIESGAYFFDPAHFLATRHKTTYFKTPWSTDQNTGFSLEYCFNPYLNIDKRGTSPTCP